MKKGFTLIELLAVLSIIGVIILISSPIISSLITDSKDQSYERQKEYIENAAKNYMSQNSLKLPDMSEGSSTCIQIITLKQKGFLKDSDIKNKIDNSTIDGSVNITYKNNKYTYTYNKDACE